MDGLTVASVMTKAALFEHMWTSLSKAMIFLTRDTGFVKECERVMVEGTHGEAGSSLLPPGGEGWRLYYMAFWW